MTSRSAVAMGLKKRALQALPLSISEVAWIGGVHAEHYRLSCCGLGCKTRYERERGWERAQVRAALREGWTGVALRQGDKGIQVEGLAQVAGGAERAGAGRDIFSSRAEDNRHVLPAGQRAQPHHGVVYILAGQRHIQHDQRRDGSGGLAAQRP